ncbi:MAG: hypothetical protein ACYSWS_06905 [Planctomycetota bacterium]
MNMKIVAFLLTLSFLAVLVSCATEEKDPGVRKFFNALSENVSEYNNLLRSNQFDKARLYVNESLWKEFDTRAKGVTIIDSRLLDRDFRELNKGREHLKIEIDYSISPSSEIKTVLDNQTWDYTSTGFFKQKKVWMLMTTLPEFK